MKCAVAVNVRATPAKIFALLTDAGDFPRWNSTVKSIEGTIANGETIKLRTTATPKVVRERHFAATPAVRRGCALDSTPPSSLLAGNELCHTTQ